MSGNGSGVGVAVGKGVGLALVRGVDVVGEHGVTKDIFNDQQTLIVGFFG